MRPDSKKERVQKINTEKIRVGYIIPFANVDQNFDSKPLFLIHISVINLAD